jgi:adenylyltransferase/sulfurtransferase
MTEVLRIVEDRYERLEQIPWWDQARLRKAQILVAGAGALGNEILKHLALLGVGRIVVVDFDKVEISNLSRAVLFRPEDRGRAKTRVVADRLRELNPEVRVLPVSGDLQWELGLGLIRRMDIVLAGLDSVGARLALNEMCWKTGVPWIDGAVGEMSGTVRAFSPPEGACFECSLTEDDYRQLSVRHSCQLLPRHGIVEAVIPTTSISASIVAAWQVQEAVKRLHGMPMIASRGISYYGLTHEVFKPRYSRRESCLGHDALPEVLALREASSDLTADQLRELLREKLRAEVEVELDREVLLAMKCPACGEHTWKGKPLFRVSYPESLCPRCGAERDLQLTHRLDGQPSLGGIRLADLGIPPLHILTARERGGRTWSFELTGDAAAGPLAEFLRREDDDGNP